MRIFVICAVMAAGAFGSNAMAQSKNFEGFSIGAHLNMLKTGFEVSTSNVTVSTSDNDVMASMQINYNYALTQTAVLGIGSSIGIGEVKAGNFLGSNLKGKSIHSYYVAPGYAVSDSLMLFGKLGVMTATGTSSTGTSDETFNGFWTGFGVRSNMSSSTYIQAEYGIAQFKSKDESTLSSRPTMSGLTFGVGYRF